MPKTKWDGYGRFCPLAKGLDVVGERWTLVIVHALLGGPSRYNELKNGLPGIGTNVLSDRLRKLEAKGVVQRTPGEVGNGVFYELTERGQALGPMMTELRRWGVDSQFEPESEQEYNFSYNIPPDLDLVESYEWIIDGQSTLLHIDGQTLHQVAGSRDNSATGAGVGSTACSDGGSGGSPVVTVTTSLAFMRLWAAGEQTWDTGRAAGDVEVRGSDDAWNRMLLATGYPGRPTGIADLLLSAQVEGAEK